MLPLLLYAPLAIGSAVLFLYSARAALNGYVRGGIVPLTFALGASLAISLYLMFGVGEPWSRWAAVALVAVLPARLLMPVALILVAVVVSWLTGKPIRWN